MADCGDLVKQEFINVWKANMQAFQEGRQALEAGKTTLAELQAKGKALNWTADVVEGLTQETALQPHEVVGISIPMKKLGDALVQSVPMATEQFINGNTRGLFQVLTEASYLSKLQPRYLFPRQGMGQGLKAYDQPTLSATQHMQDIGRFASWLAGKNLQSIEDIEANGGDILKALSTIKSPEQYAHLAKKIGDQVARNPDAALVDPTFRDKARFLFVNSLMSSLDTMGRNFMGSVMSAFHVVPESFVRPVTSRIANLVLPESKQLYTGTEMDAVRGLQAWATSMTRATKYSMQGNWKALAEMVPHSGNDAMQLGFNRYDLQRFSNTGTTNPFEGLAGTLIGWPVRLAQATDDVFKVGAAYFRAASRLHPEWVASNTNMGWSDYLERNLANMRPDIFEDVVAYSKHLTFGDDATKLTKGLLSFRETVPFSDYFMPFLQTPDRIAAMGYNHFPGLNIASTRFWRDEMMSGDPLKQADGVARIVWGNLVGSGMFVAARSGWLTSSGNLNRSLAVQEKQSEAHVPSAVKIPEWAGGGFIPIRNFGPGGQAAALIADIAGNWEALTTSGSWGSLPIWEYAIGSIGKTLFDQPMTQQISTMIKIWDEPTNQSPLQKAFQQGIQTLKAAVIPNYRLLAQVGNAIDPTMKKAETISDDIGQSGRALLDMALKDVPFAGGTPLRNPVTGKMLTAPERMVALAGPTKPIQLTDSEGVLFAKKIGVKWPEFPDAMFGTAESNNPFTYATPTGAYKKAATMPRLSERDKSEWMRLSLEEPDSGGKRFVDRLDELVQQPSFQRMNPLEQSDEMTSLYRAHMGEGQDKWLKTDVGRQYQSLVEQRGMMSPLPVDPVEAQQEMGLRRQLEQEQNLRRDVQSENALQMLEPTIEAVQ